MSFLKGGKSVFTKYHVLYLKGINIQRCYDDLLKPKGHSNYACVNWLASPPSTNNFSLSQYNLSKEETDENVLYIQRCLINAVLA